MKSRLITALAIGALTVGLLPGVASASGNLACEVDNASNDCIKQTEVTVTVSEGTTIVAPALVSIGTAFPGQMATSEAQNLSWWSNQQGMTIFADLETDPFIDQDNDNFKDVDEPSFAEDNIELATNDSSYYSSLPYDTFMPFNELDRGPASLAVPVQDVVFSGTTLESASTGSFKLEVHVPQATEGDYEAWMTYTVDQYIPWEP